MSHHKDDCYPLDVHVLADRQAARLELSAMQLDPPVWKRRTPVDYANVAVRHWPILMQGAYRGDEPADALPTAERHALVRVLHRRGMTDVEIAKRLRLSTYTAARIRGAILGLEANPDGVWVSVA